MKRRPCMPRSSKSTTEPGPPDRSGVVGRVAPGTRSSFWTPETRLAASKNNRGTTPSTTPKSSAAITTKPASRAVYSPRLNRRRIVRTNARYAARMPRASTSNPTNTARAIQGMRM